MRAFIAVNFLVLCVVAQVTAGRVVDVFQPQDAAEDLIQTPSVFSAVYDVGQCSIEGADAVTRAILESKVNAPVTLGRVPLGDCLTYYADRFDLKFDIDDKSFKAAGIRDVLSREVNHPKGQGLPFAEVLRDLLAQQQGYYEVKGDTILIKVTEH